MRSRANPDATIRPSSKTMACRANLRAAFVNRAKKVMPALAANIENYSGKYPFLVQAITQTPQYMVPAIDLAAAKGYKTLSLLIQNTQFPRQLAEGIKAAAQPKSGPRRRSDQSDRD